MTLATYRGDSRHDNSRTARRFRCAQPPELPTPQFEWLGNSQYRPIIEGATHSFTLKAYTPDQCWRIFYKAPDSLTSDELTQRFPFDMAAVAMWQLLAIAAYDLTIADDRADDEASSPPPSATCPDNQEIPY